MATATVMGYCMKCKTQREIKDSKQVTMKNGVATVAGRDSHSSHQSGARDLTKVMPRVAAHLIL